MVCLLVCGGRGYDNWWELKAVLDHFHQERPVARLVHGRCRGKRGRRGADQLAGIWAMNTLPPGSLKTYPALWDEHDLAAGALRNQQMLDEERIDVGIGFPGGPGTADMIDRLLIAGIETYRVVDGELERQSP